MKQDIVHKVILTFFCIDICLSLSKQYIIFNFLNEFRLSLKSALCKVEIVY
jgi:hypothetical protein